VFAFEWAFAPRLSAAYDLTGDGRQKVTAYWGRYYDPIRMDMTHFAGTATGQTREEQVYILNQCVTYRTHGGPSTIDGFFSPTTKTPYTDELQFQYEVDLHHNMSASAAYYHRKTRDIFEDFDPALYTEPSAYPGNVNDPNTLFLGWDYFGWTATNHPAANFFLGTLPASERNYNGLELVFRKRLADRWQSLVSYTYLDATGNAISDGNADFAGDVLWLDPRALNNQGTVAGTIHSLFKAGASYTTRYTSTRRRLSLELRPGRQHDGVRLKPSSAAPGCDVVRAPGNDRPVDCQRRHWRGAEPVVGPAGSAHSVHPADRPRDGRGLHGSVQRHEQPGGHPPAGPRRRLRYDEVPRRVRLAQAAERVPRRADPFLVRMYAVSGLSRTSGSA
jgi:hypothetical protein